MAEITTIAGRFVLDPGAPRPGGTARVWRARDHEASDGSPEVVAVKLYDGQSLESDVLRECYMREKEALSCLDHPNIVRMIDAGFCQTVGSHYVAMEWLERHVDAYLDPIDPEKRWPVVATQVLLPLLEALSAAQRRRVLHRDIKPANVMLAPENAVKLTDFGVAKLMDSVRAGLTVGELHTRPYAAPERESGELDGRSDLYSLGVTVMSLMGAPEDGLGVENLAASLQELPVSDDARGFIADLTSVDPEDRPRSAGLAAATLRQLLSWETPADGRKQGKVAVRLSRRALEQGRVILDGATESEVRGTLQKDIVDRAATLAVDERQQVVWSNETEIPLDLVGGELLYSARFAFDHSGTLVITGVTALPSSTVERIRSKGSPLEFAVSFDREIDNQRAEADALIARLSEQSSRRSLEAEARVGAELFDGWQAVLDAKKDLEGRREDPLPYRSVRTDKDSATFTLAEDGDEELVEQTRRVLLREGGALVGTVAGVVGNELEVTIERGDPSLLPREGRLLIDRTASRQALAKENDALSEVRGERSARRALRSLLVRPDSVPPLEQFELGALFQNLDEPKQKAVEVALGSRDFTLVEGPPGTGKTTFIAELIAQTVAGNPNARVLLCSQTHVAVDNAAARLKSVRPELKIVRIGREAKVGKEAQSLTVPKQLAAWRKKAETQARAFLASWGEGRGLTPESIRAYTLAGELELRRGQLEPVREKIAALRKDEDRLLEGLTDPDREPPSQTSSDEVIASEEDELGVVQDELELRRAEEAELVESADRVAAEVKEVTGAELEPGDKGWAELRKAFPMEESELERFRDLGGLQDEWLVRFGRGREFQDALIAGAQVVAGTCIGLAPVLGDDAEFDLVVVDEATKATPTEALVTMTRSHRWVLVGDEKQLPPFQDSALVTEGLLEAHGLERGDLRKTVFGHLAGRLPEDRRVALTRQYRMLAPIGDLVSACFYDGALTSERGTRSERKSLNETFPEPVVWESTSRLNNRVEQRVGTSFWSPGEVAVIRKRLKALQRNASVYDEHLTVAVIAGYGEQARRLHRNIRPSDPSWTHLEIDVHPVDSFQGQERDVVIYSVSRSNGRGDIGFLRAPERINVALSRGRDLLVIAGDAEFCERAHEGRSPFPDVLRHIRESSSCALREAR